MRPTIQIVPSTQTTEARRLLHTLSGIGSGFFQTHGFLLSVDDTFKAKRNVVRLTQKQAYYVKTVNWKYFNHQTVQDSWPTVDPATIIPDIKNVVDYSVVANDSLITDFHAVKDAFDTIIKAIGNKQAITSVSIVFSAIGTISSFNTKSGTLWISLREDADLTQLAYCYINGLLAVDTGDGDWLGAQEVMKFLFDAPAVQKALGKHTLSYDSLRQHEVSIEDKKKSDDNYAYIGFPVEFSIVREQGEFRVNTKVLSLSKSEYRALSCLYDHQGRTATFDQLADSIWGDRFYSLEALTKIIERIRKKIKAFGLHKSIILTVRGVGYQLTT